MNLTVKVGDYLKVITENLHLQRAYKNDVFRVVRVTSGGFFAQLIPQGLILEQYFPLERLLEGNLMLIDPPVDLSDKQCAEQHQLTKREQFTMAAMQAILTGESYKFYPTYSAIAFAAIEIADQVLSELEKTK